MWLLVLTVLMRQSGTHLDENGDNAHSSDAKSTSSIWPRGWRPCGWFEGMTMRATEIENMTMREHEVESFSRRNDDESCCSRERVWSLGGDDVDLCMWSAAGQRSEPSVAVPVKLLLGRPPLVFLKPFLCAQFWRGQAENLGTPWWDRPDVAPRGPGQLRTICKAQEPAWGLIQIVIDPDISWEHLRTTIVTVSMWIIDIYVDRDCWMWKSRSQIGGPCTPSTAQHSRKDFVLCIGSPNTT